MLFLSLALACASHDADDDDDDDSAEPGPEAGRVIARVEDLGACDGTGYLSVPAPAEEEGRVVGLSVLWTYPAADGGFTLFNASVATLQDGEINVQCPPIGMPQSDGLTGSLTIWVLPDRASSTEVTPQARVEDLGACSDSDTLTTAAPLASEGPVVGIDLLYTYPDGRTLFEEGAATLKDGLITIQCSSGVTVLLTTWFLPEDADSVQAGPLPSVEDLGLCPDTNYVSIYAPAGDEGRLTGLDVRYTFADGRTVFPDSATVQDGVITTQCSSGTSIALTPWILAP